MTDREWLPKTDTGVYKMTLTSISIWRDKAGEFKGIRGYFDVGDTYRYSQLFWLDKSPTRADLGALLGVPIRAEIKLLETGWQTVDLTKAKAVTPENPKEPPEYEPPTPQTTADYLDSLPEPSTDEVPF